METNNVGCGCLLIIIGLALKAWALYYVINDILLYSINHGHVGILKIIWGVILTYFIFTKFNIKIKN